MNFAIGVDLGGTNLRVAIVDKSGFIHQSIKESTTKGGMEAICDQIVSLYRRLDTINYNIVGVGVGAPGPVTKDGVVHYLSNLNISEPHNLKEMLEKRLNLPVYVGNDANVAGLAEATVGSGKKYETVQYLTLSTGIGGGLIINKKMITGNFGFAQEVGSMIVNVNGRHASPLKPDGCIENEASGTEITKKGIEAGLDVKNAGDVFALAANGNEKALKIKEEFIENMSAFIGSIVAYIEPDVFVLGGGMMKSASHFMNELKEGVKKYVPAYLQDKILIIPATYDQDCGIIGAAMLCF